MDLTDDKQIKTEEFRSVALSYIDLIYKFSLYMMGNDIDAQNLVQKAYLRAYKSFNQTEERIDFRLWLYTIFVHSLKEQTYCSKAFDSDSLEEVIFGADLNGQFSDIDIAIRKVPIRYRMILLLIDMEGFSYKDAAHIIGCSMEKVRSDITMARKLVRKSLRDHRRPIRLERHSDKLPMCL